LVYHIKGRIYLSRVFEKRVLRKVCGPKREEVVGGCRKLCNENLHKFHRSPNIIKVIK